MTNSARAAISEVAAAEKLAKAYEQVCARWQHSDTLQWQVPSIGLAAQAFLFTVNWVAQALGPRES